MAASTALLNDIVRVRQELLSRIEDLAPETVMRAPPGGGWSVAEIAEHLVRAEDYGIVGLWSALPDTDDAPTPLSEELASRTIDEVFFDLPDQVDAPPAVEPEAGGRPFAYWVARLRSHDAVIAELARAMERVGPDRVIYPHHIAGPLDGAQRLQFFRWHLERHVAQVDRTVDAIASAYP